MGGALGIFLNYYLFPMLGLGLLALGAWCTWGLWRPQGPPVAARAAALVLGLVLGWILANLPHPEDALHMLLGWPLPVMTLVRASGLWLVMDARPSIPCLLLDLVVGIGSANALLRLFWRLRPRRRVRGRGAFLDRWRVAKPVDPPRAEFARVPVQGRTGRRSLSASGLGR